MIHGKNETQRRNERREDERQGRRSGAENQKCQGEKRSVWGEEAREKIELTLIGTALTNNVIRNRTSANNQLNWREKTPPGSLRVSALLSRDPPH